MWSDSELANECRLTQSCPFWKVTHTPRDCGVARLTPQPSSVVSIGVQYDVAPKIRAKPQIDLKSKVEFGCDVAEPSCKTSEADGDNTKDG